jgi:hypothetical protein
MRSPAHRQNEQYICSFTASFGQNSDRKLNDLFRLSQRCWSRGASYVANRFPHESFANSQSRSVKGEAAGSWFRILANAAGRAFGQTLFWLFAEVEGRRPWIRIAAKEFELKSKLRGRNLLMLSIVKNREGGFSAGIRSGGYGRGVIHAGRC